MCCENIERGWVPVKIAVNSGELAFLWMDFSSVEISDPFFRQTVEKMARMGAKTKTSNVQELIDAGSRLPTVQPSCLIFHVSRCGSTLLSNALRAAGNCIALSEPKVITDLFHVSHRLPASAQKSRNQILQSVVNLYAACQGQHRNVVIKLASWNLLSLQHFREIWPQTPCILMIRDPAEVIVSNLKPGGWLAFRSEPAGGSRLLEMGEAEVGQMSDIEFCAQVIKKLNDAALKGIDDKWMIIDYDAFNFDLMPAIAQFIGFEKAALNWNAVQSTFRMYSKDADGTRVFDDDRAEKRTKAAQLITGSSAALAKESYNALLRKNIYTAK